MKNKFNWGHGIAIFYIFFVGIAVTALIASFGVDHTLVIDDYYAQDLAYQSTYEKTKNNLQSDNLKVSIEGEQVILQFTGKDEINGTVHFYRASDKAMDFDHTIISNREQISTADLAPGKWRIKIDWQEGQKKYYKEEILYL